MSSLFEPRSLRARCHAPRTHRLHRGTAARLQPHVINLHDASAADGDERRGDADWQHSHGVGHASANGEHLLRQPVQTHRRTSGTSGPGRCHDPQIHHQRRVTGASAGDGDGGDDDAPQQLSHPSPPRPRRPRLRRLSRP